MGQQIRAKHIKNDKSVCTDEHRLISKRRNKMETEENKME